MRPLAKTLQPIIWMIGLLCVFYFYQIRHALPFYSYFSDPELPYYLNSILLGSQGYVEHADHPGTLLQLIGAVIARLGDIGEPEVFQQSAINTFRLIWKWISALLAMGTIVFVWRSLPKPDRGWIFALMALLACSDYNAWIFFGTFVPEGAFLVLYTPVALWLLSRFLSGKTPSGWQLCLMGVALGLATTIKLTLWPVTLFVIWVFSIAPDKDARVAGLKRSGVFLLSTLLSFLIIGSIFAESASEQWSWIMDLLGNSGRYGQASPEGHSFLSWGDMLRYTVTGLQLQSFTTLVPMALLLLLALVDLLRRSGHDASPNTIGAKWLAIGFLVCFSLSWLMFLKHPYQIKYLFAQTPLFLSFWYVRIGLSEPAVPRYWRLAALFLLPLVALNAALNAQLVHRYHRMLHAEHVPIINEFINTGEPGKCYFSIDVFHPLKAQAFALREAQYFSDIFEETVQPSTIFRERRADYTFSNGGPLAIKSLEPQSLIFTQRFYRDPRVELIFSDPETLLFIYRTRE